jgi:hypothetical protein
MQGLRRVEAGTIIYLFILSRLTSFSRCGYVDKFKRIKKQTCQNAESKPINKRRQNNTRNTKEILLSQRWVVPIRGGRNKEQDSPEGPGKVDVIVLLFNKRFCEENLNYQIQ